MPSMLLRLSLLLLAVMTASVHARTYDYSEADGPVSSPPGTQILIANIPRDGGVCSRCVIKGWDGGFAKIRFFHAMPSPALQEFRLVAELKMDPLRVVRAPNGQGGEEFVSLSELGVEQVRRAEAVVVMETTNPYTGEVRTGTQTFQVESGPRTTLLNGRVTVGGGWRIARARDSLGSAAAINSHYKFRVRSVTWTNATFPFITQVDDRVRSRLKARQSASETEKRSPATLSAPNQTATRASGSAGTAAAESSDNTTSASGAAPTSPAGTSSGSGRTTKPSGAALPASRATSSGIYRDQATEDRERAARESGTNMIDSRRRQGEKDRAAREAEADRIVAAAIPAAQVAASLIDEMMPQTTFVQFGIGGIYGTNGMAAFFDGGPGWRLTPSWASWHLAVSPGFIFGWNEPSVERFEFLYKELSEDTASLKPAKVSGDLIIGLGGNVFFDSPWAGTSCILSAYKMWGGSEVSPGYSSDVPMPTSQLFRAELLRGLGFGDAAIAVGGGYHQHTLHYSSRTNSGTRSHTRTANGVFLSLRFVGVQMN